jgi:hypothetical protein
MIVAMLDTTYGRSVEKWSNVLARDITTRAFQGEVARWINCSSTTALSVRRSLADEIREVAEADPAQVASLVCPLIWAQESNAYDCVCFTIITPSKNIADLPNVRSQMYSNLMRATTSAEAPTSITLSL